MKCQLYHQTQPLTLTYVAPLPEFAYKTWGTRTPASRWWGRFITPWRRLDTQQFSVIYTNMLGGVRRYYGALVSRPRGEQALRDYVPGDQHLRYGVCMVCPAGSSRHRETMRASDVPWVPCRVLPSAGCSRSTLRRSLASITPLAPAHRASQYGTHNTILRYVFILVSDRSSSPLPVHMVDPN